MKKVIASAAAVIIAALLATLLLGTFSGSGIAFPAFTAGGGTTPQVLIDQGRDFGVRTGDAITVTVYVKQQPGTVVDPTSVAVTDTNNGDIEFASTVIGSRQLPHGAAEYAVALTVYKWSFQASFDITATMSYLVNSTNESATINLPKLTFYMSPTWDGRKQLQDGSKPLFRPEHTLFNGALAGIGVLGMLLCVLFIRRARRKNTLARDSIVVPPTRFEVARNAFEDIRFWIEGGDYRVAYYVELERILRQLFHIEELTRAEVKELLLVDAPWAVDDVVAVLRGCDSRIYGGNMLDAHEHELVFAAFDRLLIELPKHEPVIKAPNVVQRALHCVRLLGDLFRSGYRLLAEANVGRWVARQRLVQEIRNCVPRVRSLKHKPLAWFVGTPLAWLLRVPAQWFVGTVLRRWFWKRIQRFVWKPLYRVFHRPVRWFYRKPLRWLARRAKRVAVWSWRHRPFRYYN